MPLRNHVKRQAPKKKSHVRIMLLSALVVGLWVWPGHHAKAQEPLRSYLREAHRGDAAYDAGLYPEASRHYTTALGLGVELGVDECAHRLAAIRLYKTVPALRRSVKKHRQSIADVNIRVAFLNITGDYALASKRLAEAVALGKRELATKSVAVLDEQEAILRRSLSLLAFLHFALGANQKATTLHQRASSLMMKSIRDEPFDRFIRTALQGRQNELQGNLRTAQKLYRSALRHFPEFPVDHCNHATVLDWSINLAQKAKNQKLARKLTKKRQAFRGCPLGAKRP